MEKQLDRLKWCMERAMHGEELTIGFLGGSITQGSLASTDENCYAYLVFRWWQEKFPETEIHYVNGGIGGTTSHYGAARAITDVLMYQPDVVIVDFSVNDEANRFFQETFEGTLRRLLAWHSCPAVLVLNNVFYDTGRNAQEYHNAVADRYGIPCVSILDTVWRRMRAGEFTREEITPDGLHPNDFGHALVAREITEFLEGVRRELCDERKRAQEVQQTPLPAPLTGNAYECSRRLTIREISPQLAGFVTDTREKTGHLDHFKNGWIGKKSGDAIQFAVEASCIAVQYRKTVRRPAMRAELVLDGDEAHPMLLDGNFDEDWGDCLYIKTVLHRGERKVHTLDVRILPCGQEATPFYLMALIVA